VPILGIDHVQLAMPAGGEEQARRFYGGILGLPEVPKPPELARRGGCWFESDRVKIHLGVDKIFHPATKAHPGLLVSDLPAIIERCRAQGFDIINDAPLPGYERVFLSDPFGNRLELMQGLARQG
jgi:catechol 2,3-dioxygenase-like lactoylglutathione lyase family enzyme